MFKVNNIFKDNNKDTRTTTGMVLVSLLLTLNILHTFSSVSTVNFGQVNANWGRLSITTSLIFHMTYVLEF